MGFYHGKLALKRGAKICPKSFQKSTREFIASKQVEDKRGLGLVCEKTRKASFFADKSVKAFTWEKWLGDKSGLVRNS